MRCEVRNHIPMCSRPTVSILKLFEYELDETVWTGGRDSIITTAEEVHSLKSAVLLNRTVPTPRQIWQEATRLANYFDSIGISTVMTVPGARDLTAPDDPVEGKSLKVPAKHVRYAASTAPDARWSRAMARDPAFWWPTEGSAITPAPCAALGLLVGADVIVIDFDRLAEEDSLAFFEHIASLCPDGSPMEFTRNGAHMFFRQTDYGREAFPFVTHFGAIDVVTVASTGTPSYVEVAPSKFKRSVPGRRLGDAPLPTIPDDVVDALAAHQRACLKRKLIVGIVPDGGEAACEPHDKMPRPALGTRWLHGLDTVEAKTLFAAVGMPRMVAGTRGPTATTFMRLVPGARCYLERCVRVDHSNDFQISTHSVTGHVTVHHVGKTFRTVTADGAESDERQSFAFVPLTVATLRVLHAAWSRWPAAKCKAATDGAVFALQSAEGYKWRDFTPWATSPGPMRLSQDLWAAPDTQETARGPKPWRDARELERLGMVNIEYRRERGPLADASTRYGDSAYSWSFNSTNRCPSCSRVHGKAYMVISFESDVSKPVLFAECSTKGLGLNGELPPLTEAAALRETRRLLELGAMFAEPAEAASVHPTLTDSAEDTARFGALLGAVKSANGQRDAFVEACAAVFRACWDAPWVARARVRPIEPGRYFAETYAQRVKAAGYCCKTGFYVVCRGDKGDFRVTPRRQSGVPLLMPTQYAEWRVVI